MTKEEIDTARLNRPRPLRYRQVTIDLLNTFIATFDLDPPDSEFQRGYLQALLDLRAQLLKTN
jgi:hypothetical protein